MEHDLPRARCWLEVDTRALLHNLRQVCSLMRKNTELIAVLKADAYGLGIAPVGRLFWEQGVRKFAVACLEEAFQLREALPNAWILCMGETLNGALKQAIRQGIRLTVGSLESAQRVKESAAQAQQTAYVHCKLDTGLYRIGLPPENAADQIAQISALPRINVEGLYTHLALHTREGDLKQHAIMENVLSELTLKNLLPPIVHMLDSIGLIRYPDWQYNAVRIGAMLYGNPPRDYDAIGQTMPPVRFVARVARVRQVGAGECVGYDDTHPLRRDTLIATLTAGYVDGYPRAMSHCGVVEIHGQRAPVIGLICMDQMMVDVTDIPGVQPGDEAVLLGGGIGLREYAEIGHMNRNECTAIIGKRVPRIYL